MIKSEKARSNAIKTNNGTMRTSVSFFKSGIDTSLDGREEPAEKLYSAYSEIYNPSNKDRQILTSKGVHRAVTIRLRDPLTTYQPNSKHFAKIDDPRYSDKDWEIIDFHPDYQERQFLVILLGGDN